MRSASVLSLLIEAFNQYDVTLVDVYLPEYFTRSIENKTDRIQMNALNRHFGTNHPIADNAKEWVEMFKRHTLPKL